MERVMLKFIVPDDTKYQTEEEFWEALVAELGDDRRYETMRSFIIAAKEAHRSMRQVIHYTFEKSSFAKLGIDVRKVLFLDPAYPDRKPIGVVTHVSYTDQYEIYNRNTTVSRGDRYKNMLADRTKDIKKAVSIFKKQVTLYEEEEVASLSDGEAREAIRSWVAEINVPSTLLQNPDHVEEMSNLVKQGVTFKTGTFKNAAEQLPNAIERHRRLGIANLEMVCVIETRNGGLSVSKREGTTLYKYESPEQLPEAILGKFSLLRIMPPSTHLPEVGYRTADGVSWIFGVERQEWEQLVASKYS
jgi:hypothetical protein